MNAPVRRTPERKEGAAGVRFNTPPELLARCRRVLGWFDLDPATTESANKAVKARNIYTAKTDGLAHVWEGKVFMNPPFKREGGEESFVRHLMRDAVAGSVTEAIAIVKGDTRRRWMHEAFFFFDACMLSGSITFVDDKTGKWVVNKKGHKSSFGWPICALYWGPKQHRFVDEFRLIGTVRKRGPA